MTATSLAGFFFALVLVALIPGPGVFIVIARALSSGFQRGLATVVGIVCGDFVFIITAIFGLMMIAEAMSTWFFVLKYIGAAYLIWLGVKLLRTEFDQIRTPTKVRGSYLGNFLIGFVTTLGNPKAILFYLSLFPAFIEPDRVSALDIVLLLSTAALAVGGVMTAYAYLAAKSHLLFANQQRNRILGKFSGGTLIGSGVLLALKN